MRDRSPGRRPHVLLAIAFAAALPTSTAAQVGQVNGTVLDADSRQLPGASVALIPTSGSTIYGTSSGPDGRYAFKGLTSDTYNVVMSTPDGRIVRKNGVHVRALFRSIVDFKLTAGAWDPAPAPVPAMSPEPGSATFSITWEVTGPTREPIPEASVSLSPLDGKAAMRQGRTGPDGKYRFDGVHEGTYRISARAAGFMSWSLGPLPLRGPQDKVLSLSLVSFPMKFHGSIEDLLIPFEPIPPHGH